jgi:hypothetical protein
VAAGTLDVAEGWIRAMRFVVNPEKLKGLPPLEERDPERKE